YLVDQGFRVFMMSWKNPDETYRDVGFEDYMQEGLLAAMGVVQSICDVKKINLAGYCIGGTLMAHTLAYLAAAKKDIVQSATFMTTMTDYTNTGDLGVFIDEEQLAKLDAKMSEKGYLDGAEMAGTFSALRSADLYWGFVVNQYMLGEKPSAFDILFWNANATRMPFKMHSWYLRELYLNNSFAKGNVTMLGEKLDMGKIAAPIYMVGAQSDHITPWQSCYQGLAKMGSTSKRFALTKAGHVAGVCNPPTPEGKPVKRSFMVADAKAPLGEAWSATAETKPDSWWPDWKAWLADQSGKDIAAPKSQGGNGYKILGAAPGTYVKE
ncbi:MAG: class I poly(R)-hydroxyalkanoic acid synthase, partial [Alphaproteobacteria bacterium CG_4_10_14_0_8_um_filter_53_9]